MRIYKLLLKTVILEYTFWFKTKLLLMCFIDLLIFCIMFFMKNIIPILKIIFKALLLVL